MSRDRRLQRALDAIVRGRRPPRFPAEDDDGRALLTAARLAAGKPGADLPDPQFLDRLAGRLRTEAAAGETATEHVPVGRRRFIQGAGIAAAAVAAGVGIDRGAVRLTGTDNRITGDLVPDSGRWVAVAATADLASGRPVRFAAGAVNGFLMSRGGAVNAVSAVCTHMGCLLNFDAAGDRLACPCHRATFALDGTPSNPEYLNPLPHIRARVSGDQVEVYIA